MSRKHPVKRSGYACSASQRPETYPSCCATSGGECPVTQFAVVCRDICKQRSSSFRRWLDQTSAVLHYLGVSL